jgi:hypothetical protein
MAYGARIFFMEKQKSEIWDRWQRGESMRSIGRFFDRGSSSIYPLQERTVGIRPAVRTWSRLASTYARKFFRDVVKLLNACIWEFLSDGQPSKKKVIRDTQDRFKEENEARRTDSLPELNVPSATEIELRINRFKRFHKKAARHGVSAAQRDISIYEGGLKISHPLQLVEMHEWTIDVF